MGARSVLLDILVLHSFAACQRRFLVKVDDLFAPEVRQGGIRVGMAVRFADGAGGLAGLADAAVGGDAQRGGDRARCGPHTSASWTSGRDTAPPSRRPPMARPRRRTRIGPLAGTMTDVTDFGPLSETPHNRSYGEFAKTGVNVSYASLLTIPLHQAERQFNRLFDESKADEVAPFARLASLEPALVELLAKALLAEGVVAAFLTPPVVGAV